MELREGERERERERERENQCATPMHESHRCQSNSFKLIGPEAARLSRD